MKPYVIGIDYGTLSGRAILLDTVSGKELAESVCLYAHGVMDECLPCGKVLPAAFALQHPADYLQVLQTTIPQVLEKANIPAQQVAAICIDFTASTVLPTDEAGVPLCMKPEFASEPHAYVKLWKHHGAQSQAERIIALAKERDEEWLARYGGNVSCEWLLPKLLEVLEKAPQVFDQTVHFLEAADWLTWLLTDNLVGSAAFAGYKALWNERDGYPSNDFLTALNPRLDGCVGRLLVKDVLPIGQQAGVLTQKGSELTGLPVGTMVAVPTIDAHAAMPALNITGTRELMLVMGTSSCHIINGDKETFVPGICGYVKDSVIPGLYTYEAGQACVGDSYAWFVKNSVPREYAQEATEKGISLHQLLQEKCAGLRPGQSGLVALDWLNGSRSVLVDSGLKGMVVGLTLQTKPEELYRAFLESTAYGTRRILELYEENGVPIRSICAAGGISAKSPFLMQLYADITGRPIRVAGTTQAAALGSAIYASVAAGLFPTVAQAAQKLSPPDMAEYFPNREAGAAYEPLYACYKTLHNYFGRENPQLMHDLDKAK